MNIYNTTQVSWWRLFILGLAVNLNSSENCIKMSIERIADEFDELNAEHHARRFVDLAILEREM